MFIGFCRWILRIFSISDRFQSRLAEWLHVYMVPGTRPSGEVQVRGIVGRIFLFQNSFRFHLDLESEWGMLWKLERTGNFALTWWLTQKHADGKTKGLAHQSRAERECLDTKRTLSDSWLGGLRKLWPELWPVQLSTCALYSTSLDADWPIYWIAMNHLKPCENTTCRVHQTELQDGWGSFWVWSHLGRCWWALRQWEALFGCRASLFLLSCEITEVIISFE